MSNLDYGVLIEPLGQEDGGGFVAAVPDLPGCMSDGDTPEDALAHVQDAIAAWIEEARARWAVLCPGPRNDTSWQNSDRTT